MIDFSKLDPNEILPDSGETLEISPLALLKMLRHGRAGVPLEVMGLLLGKHVDAFTISISDVYAMPQTGTGVTVESVDPVYQTMMTEALRQVNKNEDVVGWYHSHPGFGCWLSSTDMSTQDTFEKLNKRAVAVVIDPIQSVKGMVVMSAFRLIGNQFLVTGIEPRQVTGNMGFLQRPTMVALLHGLGRSYYSLRIKYEKGVLEERMLVNMNRKTWADNLKVKEINEEKENEIVDHVSGFIKSCDMEKRLNDKELEIHRVGKIDYRRRVIEDCDEIGNKKILNNLLLSIHSHIFSF
jgi:26S proteasome regulatory subunit N11